MISYKDFQTDETSDAFKARKLIEQFEGNQLKWVELGLDGGVRGGYGFRHNWRKRGFTPRTRNIVKPIVEKSATLFQAPAQYLILPEGNPEGEPVVDAKLGQIMVAADWTEFSRQLEDYTRLLQSSCTYQLKIVPEGVTTVDQIYRFADDRGDAWIPMLLHVGNAVVLMNQQRTVVLELAYVTFGTPGDRTGWRYVHVDASSITEFLVKDDKEVQIGQVTNLDGFVPASMNYDTKKPKTGVWCKVPEDLASAQDLYNTHLTDLEFALATDKGQPLILTNASIMTGESEPAYATAGAPETIHSLSNQGQIGYRMGAPSQTTMGGIGSVIELKASKNAPHPPTADFKGPSVDLAAHDAVVRMLLEDVANDWCVRLKMAGSGSANSGFQLIVEEIDNLQLREQRAMAFTASLRRMYAIMQLLYPELTAGDLQVVFSDPSLPVNNVEELQLWSDKFANGLASPIDYFMQVEGLDAAEAEKRAETVKAYLVEYGPQLPPIAPPGSAVNVLAATKNP